MKIELHIDRLVLRGIDLPRHQHRDLKTAVASELARLLASDNAVSDRLSAGAIPLLATADIHLPPAGAGKNQTETLAGRIATAVYQGIGS